MQNEYPETIVKFFKVLKELRLDYNIGIFITGIENIFHSNKIDNFIYLLRSSSLYFPNFIKIILTMEKRPNELDKFTKILKIL